MPVLCAVSGLVRGKQGVIAGAKVSIARATVDGSRSTTYETTVYTNSSGIFSFNLPYGARVRFGSSDVSDLNGFKFSVPNSPSINLGNFLADVVTEPEARDSSSLGAIPAAVKDYVSVQEYGSAAGRQLVFTLVACPVTLVKNGTSSGGGGTTIYTFPAGMLLPKGGSSNLTIAAAGDKSFLASVGSAAAGTDGTLTSTEISFLPSTAATTSSGAGTCKMKATSTTPTPGGWLDGTSSAVSIILNSALNSDATGVEALTYSGTITINCEQGGDN